MVILGVCLLVLLIGFLLLSSLIMLGARGETPDDLDVLIVLGAQIKPDGTPVRLLRFRLETALTYLEVHPHTLAIVSGGQGADEPCSEATAMAEWLIEHGLDQNRLFLEESSTTTAENIALSLRLLDERGPADARAGLRIGLVTNSFHVFRAIRTARRQGITQVWGIPARSTARRLPANLVRECGAIIKNFLQGNI